MMKILHIVGARPNFIKAAPLVNELKLYDGIEQIIVHTGQHYDRELSELIIEQLGMPIPNINLNVGSGSHLWQISEIIRRCEERLKEIKPDLVIVYGDVNSTFAGAFAAYKLGFDVAHVEAGLRSFDETMPEEMNRILVDRLSKYLFAPTEDAVVNLRKEGISKDRIFFVGNIMIDSLVRMIPKAREVFERKTCELPRKKDYVLATIHRPSNVLNSEKLKEILSAFVDISRDYDVIFPAHPFVRKSIEDKNGEIPEKEKINIIKPLGYLEFLSLMLNAKAVITDSGGIQEETTYLRIPCITVRDSTERPITVEKGTNRLVKAEKEKIEKAFFESIEGKKGIETSIPMWDGKTSRRIAKILSEIQNYSMR